MKEQIKPNSPDNMRQELSAKGVRLVDISKERGKEKLMGISEFAEKLSKYQLKDFLFSEEPYYDLMEYSRAQPGLFEQFSSVLMETAGLSVPKETFEHYEKEIAGKIALYREEYIPMLTEAASILDYISLVEKDPKTSDKVSVLPLMCGSGKSTALTKKIIELPV